MEVLGEHPLAVRSDGHPVNYKSCLFLPTKGLLPIAIVSSTPESHNQGVLQALPAVARARENAGMGRPSQEEMGQIMNQLVLDGGYVPLVIMGRGDETRVAIRPDFNFYFGYRRAVDILRGHPLNIPAEKISFMRVMDPETREITKCIGCMHMISPLDREEDSVLAAVRGSERMSNAGNRFFASERVSYMSLSQLRDVLSDLGDREKFQRRLGEIVSMYEERPLHVPGGGEGAARQLDFLLVTSNRALDTDTTFIFDGLREIAVQSQRADNWGVETQAGIRKRFENLLSKFRRENNSNFNEIDLDNMSPEVRNTLYGVVRGIKSEAEMLRLGTEFRGFITPRPGGYIVGRESNGAYAPGLEVNVSQLPEKTRRILRRGQALLPHQDYIVVTPEEVDGEVESVQTFQVKNVPKGKVVWRYWVFDEQTDPPTKDLLNDLLREHPNLRYAYVCSVPESRSRRDMLAADIKVFGAPEREVKIPVYMAEGGPEVKLLDRLVKSHAGVFLRQGLPLEHAIATARAYEFNLGDRVACIQQLCPSAGVPDWEIYHTHMEVPAVGRVPIAHGIREYIDGPPTNRMPLDRYNSTRFVESLLGCKGRIAAVNMVIGRILFDDGDEVVSVRDKKGSPTQLRLVDPTTSFRDVDTPLRDSVGLYSCALAGDLVKYYLTMGRWSRPLWGASRLLHTVGSRFYDAFEREFVDVQGHYRSKRHFFDTLVEERVNRDVAAATVLGDDVAVDARLNPAYDEWDMRSKWPRVLKRLDESNVGEIVDAMRSATRRIYETKFVVVEGLPYSEQARVLDLFTRTLSMNHRDIDQLLDVVNNDTEFSSLSFDDRVRRINAMRVSTWIYMTGYNPANVRGHALECSAGRSEEEARAEFKNTVNGKFFKLNLSDELSGVFFDLMKDPALAQTLESKGYILRPRSLPPVIM